ncbi:M12 family metallo-peptidase [Coraliomargarita sp. W4R53]
MSESSSSALIDVIAHNGGALTWSSRNPAAYRALRVEVDPRLFEVSLETLRVGDVLRFDLFDGAQVSARVSKTQLWGRDAETLGVTARMSEQPGSFVTLSSTGGLLRAWIHDAEAGRDYQLRYDVVRQTHVLLEIDTAGSEVYSCGSDDHDHEAAPLADEVGGVNAENVSTSESPSGDSIVDVMVVYTSGALAHEGSQANMDANISEAYLKANLVHANSLTELEVNVVHALEVDYDESYSASADLYALSRFDDVIDHVNYLREYVYFADFVSFFVDTNSAGGLGFRPSSYDRIDYGYSLVRVQQSDTTSYTTVHELGHNMGLGHSRGQRQQAFKSGIQPYAAGWQWANEDSPASVGYCSVMTYEDFDGTGADEYDRVGYFSNPEVYYEGDATGDVNSGNAASVLREGREFYVGFLEPLEYPVQRTLPYSLGFEAGEDASLWQQFRSDSQDWELAQTGETPSSSTGPSGAESGARYAYVEASEHSYDSALLTADFDFTFANEPRVSFAYHMDDSGSRQMGHLYFEISRDGGLNWDRVFECTSGQGAVWNTAEIDLSSYAGQVVRMHFRADVGSGYRSDIAIDSILVEDAVASDSATIFTNWLEEYYPSISDLSVDGDPDGDGVSSFLEYALGRSPADFESGGLPVSEINPSERKLVFSFRRGQQNVRYIVQSAADLTNWTNPDLEWDSLASPAPLDLVEVGEIQSVEIDMSGTSRFVRLHVSE